VTYKNNPLSPSDDAAQLLAESPLLRTKLARALFCSPAECQQALEEVIKFLILAAESSDQPVTPSARVDMAWHEFILFTKTYVGFCQHKFGRMVHHEPSIDHEANSQQYTATLNRYRQRFGDPPSEYWGGSQASSRKGASAFCGSCESDL
jgi:hypothetical protein